MIKNYLKLVSTTMHSTSIFVFLLSLLVGICGAFFLGNSFGDIGYPGQNMIGGYIGLAISGLLFIIGALTLARSHRKAIEQQTPLPMTNTY